MSPIQETHKLLRERGYYVAKTEYWHHFAKRRMDLCGFIDTLALNSITFDDLLAIQSTTGDHHAHRRTKILASEVTPLWLRHARLEIWSWSMTGPRGRRKRLTLRRERFILDALGQVKSYETEEPVASCNESDLALQP
jgi:hypothetical protein